MGLDYFFTDSAGDDTTVLADAVNITVIGDTAYSSAGAGTIEDLWNKIDADYSDDAIRDTIIKKSWTSITHTDSDSSHDTIVLHYVYEIDNNRSLTIGDPDSSTYQGACSFSLENSGGSGADCLKWINRTSDLTCIIVESDSAFTIDVTGNISSIIECDASQTYDSYLEFIGSITFVGKEFNWNGSRIDKTNILINNCCSIKFYHENEYNDQELISHNFEYFTVNYLPSSSEDKIFHLQSYDINNSYNWDISFDHITINGEYSTSGSGYAFYMETSSLSDCTFNDISVTGTKYGIFSNSSMKITNSYFSSISKYWRQTTSSSDRYNKELNSNFYQPKITYENCTFKKNYTDTVTEFGDDPPQNSPGNPIKCSFYGIMNGIIKFKNCTFSDISNTNIRAVGGYDNMVFLFQGSITLTTITSYFGSAGNTKYFGVSELDLTVLDINNQPIEKATVIVSQSDDNEQWEFETDSQGNIKDINGDNPVFTYVQWLNYVTGAAYNIISASFDTSGHHTITIHKKGYNSWTRDVFFGEGSSPSAFAAVSLATASNDHVIVANLKPLTGIGFTPIIF